MPMIEREMVVRRGWIDQAEMSQAVAIAASAPGGVAVNVAAYLGYRLARLPGMAAAVAGMMLPAFVIILLLGAAYTRLSDNPIFVSAWHGIQVAVLAMILHAAIRMAGTALIDKLTLFIAASSVALLAMFGLHPILLLLFGGGIGLAAMIVKQHIAREKVTRVGRAKEGELPG